MLLNSRSVFEINYVSHVAKIKFMLFVALLFFKLFGRQTRFFCNAFCLGLKKFLNRRALYIIFPIFEF